MTLMDAQAQKISTEINQAIDNDQLVLPTMPEMALQVREVAEDPDASILKLVEVIGSDAALTARIIKVANSPLFRATSEIEDLKMALMRLGMQYTCNLATGLAMEQMFQATSDMIDKRLRGVWSRSTEIAGICHVLCRHYAKKLRPEQATLAGLMHQIGVLPILSYVEDNPGSVKDSITLDTIVEQLHPQIGTKILKAWDFPEELHEVPQNYLNFSRKIPAADYGDLVTIATLQSYVDSNDQLGQVDYHSVTAFERLGLDPDIQSAEAEDLSEEMEAAMALLQ